MPFIFSLDPSQLSIQTEESSEKKFKLMLLNQHTKREDTGRLFNTEEIPQCREDSSIQRGFGNKKRKRGKTGCRLK
jgi:hypothetical protein